MDEKSWEAKLAKSNINITDIHFNATHTMCEVCYEFPYHPKPGQVKWLKTVRQMVYLPEGEEDKGLIFMHQIAEDLSQRVLQIRKELEG